MIKKFCLLALSGFLTDIVKGCKQVTVKEFKNWKKTTDYVTENDEITMRFGVGKVVAYQYSNLFSAEEEIDVGDGEISFPCFNNEAFYLYINEHDVSEDDKTVQVSLGCLDLQANENVIKVHVTETGKALETVFDALKNDDGETTFDFLNEAALDQAVYSVALNVEGACKEDGEFKPSSGEHEIEGGRL